MGILLRKFYDCSRARFQPDSRTRHVVYPGRVRGCADGSRMFWQRETDIPGYQYAADDGSGSGSGWSTAAITLASSSGATSNGGGPGGLPWLTRPLAPLLAPIIGGGGAKAAVPVALPSYELRRLVALARAAGRPFELTYTPS